MNKKKKGTDFEREVVQSLKSLDPKVRRTVMSGAIGNTIESEKGDIYCPTLNLTIECKRTEKLKPYEFYEQAQSEARPLTMPIVVMRSSGKDALALLAWSDLLLLLTRTEDNGRTKKQQSTTGLPLGKKISPITDKATAYSGLMFSKEYQTRKKAK